MAPSPIPQPTKDFSYLWNGGPTPTPDPARFDNLFGIGKASPAASAPTFFQNCEIMGLALVLGLLFLLMLTGAGAIVAYFRKDKIYFKSVKDVGEKFLRHILGAIAFPIAIFLGIRFWWKWLKISYGADAATQKRLFRQLLKAAFLMQGRSRR